MKILKNLKTPVLALIFGLGLVFSQSAFKASGDDVLWVRDATNQWREAGTVDGYCDGDSGFCSGYFADGIDPNVPVSNNPTIYPQPQSPTLGTFISY